tara:strand:+ start:117 stop:611 length:495 start_codon:yes stop_codon:yes gene_type:complete
MENLTYFLEQYEPIRNTHRIIKEMTTDNFWDLCEKTLILDIQSSKEQASRDIRFGVYFYNGNNLERRTLFAPTHPLVPYVSEIWISEILYSLNNTSELFEIYNNLSELYANLQLKGVRRFVQNNVLRSYLYFYSAQQETITPFFEEYPTSLQKTLNIPWQQEGF